MNSDSETEGRKLLQTWRSAKTSVVIDFLNSRRDSSLNDVGRIVTYDDDLIILESDSGDEVRCELSGCRFTRVETRALFRRSPWLDPIAYRETVEIHLPNMDRLTVAAPVKLPPKWWLAIRRMFRKLFFKNAIPPTDQYPF